MSNQIGLGIAVEGQEGLDWRRWRTLCQLTDKLGFDSLWRSDHLQSVIDGPERECLEAWTSLALAAEWTRRIEFGPLVTPMTFRPPGVLARMATSVEALSAGRLVLGLGAGWNQAEHAAFGIPFQESTSARLAYLEGGIQEIRRIHESYNPKPVRKPIPILIGGSGKHKSAAIAARHAAEYNAGELTPAQFAACSETLDEMCAAIGRPVESLRRSVTLSVLIGRNEHDLQTKAGELSNIMPEFANKQPAEILETLRAHAPGPWVIGTGSQVIAQLADYAPFKLSRFILTLWLLDDLEDTLDLLSQEVAPHLIGLGQN